MKRSSIICLVLVVIICLLSSCGKEKEAIELNFDNKITWTSTYDDIINAYGQSSLVSSVNYGNNSEYKDDECSGITYEFNCCGYSDFGLTIIYNFTRSRITQMYVVKDYKDYDQCIKEFNGILSSLESKYGKPEKNNEKTGDGKDHIEYYQWNTQIQNTTLAFTLREFSEGMYRITLSYINLTIPNNGI